MNSPGLLILFIIVSLFATAFTVRQYRKASAPQRRQILLAALGAFGIAAVLICAVAFSHQNR